jgi:hypothetical protein
MSHSISVYLIRKEEIRDSKIETVLENKKIEIKFKELGSNILATTRIPNIKEFGIDKTIAKIETDYFGGSGYQSAKLFVNNKKTYDKSSEQDWSSNPINDILKEMGVCAVDGQDEFDTIGLGKYRTNIDFN